LEFSSLAVVGGEEEQLVPDDRTARGGAELIYVQRVLRLMVDLANQVGGIETLVAILPK